MKAVLAAIAAVALLAAPAYAQQAGPKAKGSHRSEQKTDTKKADDKGYNAALNKLPDQNQKIDPWAGVRPEAPTKTGH